MNELRKLKFKNTVNEGELGKSKNFSRTSNGNWSKKR